LQQKKLIKLAIVLSFLIFIPFFGSLYNFQIARTNEIYSYEEKIRSLRSTQDTPYIRYTGPNNHPIEGIDLKSYNDELFEIDFRLEDNTDDEWVLRVYAYLDFDMEDTILTKSENFQDGSNSKHYGPGSQPSTEELNPDETFMGNTYIKILENFEEFTMSEKDYTAKKQYPGYIDQSLYFHVKVLYRSDDTESDGLHRRYYYRTFYISWFWTRDFKHSPLKIIDDDTTPPEFLDVDILNSPIYDNHTEINFEISVEDDSGIADLYINFLGTNYFDDDHDFQISIQNPSLPGEYNFNVIALDDDTDRDDDQLKTTLYSNFEILDDDVDTPVCANVCIVNAPIYDAYDYVIFEFKVEDPSGISELYIEFMDVKYYPDVNDQIPVPNPRIPDLYDFSAIAIDADLDHQGDQLNTTINAQFEVFDDDVSPPQIFIHEDEFDWCVSINDDDGIIDSTASGNYSVIDQHGNTISSGIILQEKTFCFINKKVIPLKIGTYTLEISATNNDLEWLGDEETSSSSDEVTITLEDCYNYVIQQIEKLKEYIENNVPCFTDYFKIELSSVQKFIQRAYIQTIQLDLNMALNYLNSANTRIYVVECVIEYLIICLFPDIGNYILQSLSDIRHNVLLLMEISADYITGLN